MIRIRDVSRVTHVVADREAALALYRDVFGAKVFYEGPLGPRAGNVTLLTLADACVELVDPFDLAEGPRSYLERYGGFLRSFTFKVADAAEAAAHLRAAGVGVVEESPGHCTADPERTFGTIIEFSDADLPNDPRREPGFYERSLEGDGAMGAQRLWSITLLADDLDAVDDFFGSVLGGVFIGGRTNGIYATASHFFVYERARISILKPRRDNNVLSSVINRQGGQGLHTLAIVVRDLEEAGRYLRSKGIGLLHDKALRYTVHPRSGLGSRLLLMPRPDPNDPDYDWLDPKLATSLF